MKCRFLKFLMDNGIYRAYNANVRDKNIEDPDLYISCAFFWDDTNEGYLFWLDINNRWLKIVLEETKSQIQKDQLVGCSFCNGKSEIESTGVKIRLLKNKSTLEVEIDTLCYMCDENISGYSEFNIKYCPMCGYEVSNFKEQRSINKFFFVGDSNNATYYLKELIRLGGVCNDPCMTGSNPSLIYYIEQTTNYICSTHISNRNKYLEMDYVDISNIYNA